MSSKSHPRMVTFEEAQEILLQKALGGSAVDEMPIVEAVGYVLAERIEADIEMPRFDKAAMDGFAFRHQPEAEPDSFGQSPFRGNDPAAHRPNALRRRFGDSGRDAYDSSAPSPGSARRRFRLSDGAQTGPQGRPQGEGPGHPVRPHPEELTPDGEAERRRWNLRP